MLQYILALVPILVFLAVFFFSIWDRKKKEEFSDSYFWSFLPSIFTHTFPSVLSQDQIFESIRNSGYVPKKKGEGVYFQNASTLEKHRNWLWSYGIVKKKEEGSYFCKLYVNAGAVITVPAALLVVVFYGLLVQNSFPEDRVSVIPYFFLGFAFFFAISSLISQTIKERKYFRDSILKY